MSRGNAYAVGAIPRDVLSEDLRAAGVTYSPGRGNGYRLDGAPADRYAVGDVVADTFADAAAALSRYLAEEPLSRRVDEARRHLARLPFADSAAFTEALDRARAELLSAEDAFASVTGLEHPQLAMQAESLAATARSIRSFQAVRFEAVRRFAQPLAPAPIARPPTSAEEDVVAFLETLPPSRLKRSTLPALAAEAGLTIGDRALYALAGTPAAPGVLGIPTRHRGEWHYSARP